MGKTMRGGRLAGLTFAMVMAMVLGAQAALAEPTLEAVRKRGYLNCGIGSGGAGQNELTQQGRWTGFYPDFCRAIAAAVLGKADAVEFVVTEWSSWMEAVLNGGVDVLVDGRTETLRRAAGQGVDFPTIYYYDGQGFLAHKSLAAHRLAEVTQASVCVDTGSTSAENLRDLAKSSKPGLKVVVFDSFEGALNGFFTRRCDLFSTDRLALVAIRAKRTPNASEYVIFPDVVSKEPLGPVVRDNDPQWSDVIKWVVAATIAAEELGLARDNIAEQRKAPRSPDVARFLGSESGNGKALGLAEDWAYQVVAQIGNYAEIHDRNVGEGSSLKLDRGLNALWNRGGLLYASPLH